jgi:hypothetical protein
MEGCKKPFPGTQEKFFGGWREKKLESCVIINVSKLKKTV